MKDRESGAWFEGKIIRIVYDPDIPHTPDANLSSNDTSVLGHSENSDQSFDTENDVENKPPSASTNGDSLPKAKSKGIAKYFSRTPKIAWKKQNELNKSLESKDDRDVDAKLLYKVQLESEWVVNVFLHF